MAKRSTTWTKNKYNRYLKEGRGTGEGKSYIPWIKTQDFPTLGRATRILGNKTGRVHHLFSDLQTMCFYILEFEFNIVDIREHIPLLDLENVIDSSDINLELFKDKYTGEQYVLTTTFLLTTKDKEGNKNYYARSVKSKQELLKKTSIEKLEIERRYWEKKNIHFAIITEENIPKMKAKNIEWLHGVMTEYKDYGIDQREVVRLCAEFMDSLFTLDLAINMIIKMFEKEYDLVKGTGLLLFKYLLVSRVISVDLNIEIDLTKTIKDLVVEVGDCAC